MMNSTAARPRALLRSALGLGAVAVALLAFPGGAGAAVITVTPDGTSGTDNLTAAINTANTNTDTSNTIILNPGNLSGTNTARYTPKAGITIGNSSTAKTLTITGPHAAQAGTGAAATVIDGSIQANTPADLFTILSNATVNIDGVQVQSGGGDSQHAQFRVNGILNVWDSAFLSAVGSAADVSLGGTFNFHTSDIEATQATSINNQNGTTNLDHSDVLFPGSGAGAIGSIVSTGGTVTLNNTILAAASGSECVGVSTQPTGNNSIDDDGTCGVTHSADANIATAYTYAANNNGGPTDSQIYPAGNPDTSLLGTNCPIVDQRFFVNPVNSSGVPQCDIGADTTTATQQTTGPTCVVTNTNLTSNPATQTVAVQDTKSGLGPERGTFNDLFQPTATFNPAVTNPDDPITDMTITNGSVTAPSFPSAPSSTAPLSITATKANQSLLTRWHFWATNWAGVSTYCN